MWSDWVLINCFSNPVIDISNIVNDEIVNNQSYTFQGSYSQAQNDLLQYYKYILYDSNNIKISESSLSFDGLLQYQFDGLENSKSYHIELQATTQHNITVSIIKQFTVDYIQPIFNNFFEITNNPSQASVDIQIIAIRTLGYANSGNIAIENGEWLNTLTGVFSTDNNHGLQLKKSDWTIQMWVKNLIDDKIIFVLYGQNNVTFKIKYEGGQFHLYKYISEISFAHYRSNIINPSIDSVVYLFCQSIDDRINLKCQIIN